LYGDVFFVQQFEVTKRCGAKQWYILPAICMEKVDLLGMRPIKIRQKRQVFFDLKIVNYSKGLIENIVAPPNEAS